MRSVPDGGCSLTASRRTDPVDLHPIKKHISNSWRFPFDAFPIFHSKKDAPFRHSRFLNLGTPVPLHFKEDSVGPCL